MLIVLGAHELHLNISEIYALKVGEMVDLINCLAVYKGTAKFKKKLTYDQIMQLR